jgi:hypothetical protein
MSRLERFIRHAAFGAGAVILLDGLWRRHQRKMVMRERAAVWRRAVTFAKDQLGKPYTFGDNADGN